MTGTIRFVPQAPVPPVLREDFSMTSTDEERMDAIRHAHTTSHNDPTSEATATTGLTLSASSQRSSATQTRPARER